MSKTLAILNPISGHGRGARVWPEIDAALREGGLDFDLARTHAPREAVVIARDAKLSGYETLISVGGDGTLNEVVNGMMRASNGEPTGTLGIISIGSGNDFIKSFSPTLGRQPTGHFADWRPRVQLILAGKTRAVDVGRVIADHPAPHFDADAFYFVNCLDAGFAAQVGRHAHDFPFLQGTAMYLASVFKTLLNYAPLRVKIQLDDAHSEQSSAVIAVANGRCIGGGFWVAPEALHDDGLFDVMIADGLNRRGILALLPKVMQGMHLKEPCVKFVRATRVTLESLAPLIVESDGEIPFIGAQRVQIENLPKRVRVFA